MAPERCSNYGQVSYTETKWRKLLSLFSLIDGNTQYFLAGAAKAQDDTDPVHLDETWFGCSTVATPGGLCEVSD